MTERKNDNALFAALAARRRAERAEKLARTKLEAAERGKQPFDLDALEELYDTHSPGGFQLPREERERDYEYRYYAQSPKIMTIAEFAAQETAYDANTIVPTPGAPAEQTKTSATTTTTRVAGVDISGADAVEQLVIRQLEVGGVWSDRADHNQVDGLRRAMRNAGKLLPAFGRALLGGLEHVDLRVRSGAIAALGDARGYVSAEDALAVLERSPQLFVGVAPSSDLLVQEPDLESALVHSIARLIKYGDTRATAFLRAYLARSKSLVVLLGLAEAAPDWIVAHAATVVPRSAVGGVLRKLPEAKQRRALLRALAPWPADEGRETVAKSFWDTLPISKAERVELKRIVSPED